MDSKYDIYKRLPEERLLWVSRVKAIDEARRLVAALQSASFDQYLVYDFRERRVVKVFGREAEGADQLAA
jgi:hypothetical protein